MGTGIALTPDAKRVPKIPLISPLKTGDTAAACSPQARLPQAHSLEALCTATLPPKVARTAQRILKRIATGMPYWQLGGKRLDLDRTLVSIPIGRRYRLLCRVVEGQLTPLRILSHEQYNSPHHWPKG